MLVESLEGAMFTRFFSARKRFDLKCGCDLRARHIRLKQVTRLVEVVITQTVKSYKENKRMPK